MYVNATPRAVLSIVRGTAHPAVHPSLSPIQISTIVIGITCSILALPGVICNLLSIVIFAKVGKTTLSVTLYKILALADSGVLVILTVNWSPVAWEMLFGDWLFYMYKISPALQYLNYLEETLKDFAVWMVVLVTVERYAKLYRPSFYSKCRPGSAKYMTAAILIVLMVFNTYVLLTAPLDPMVADNTNSIHAVFYTMDCLVNIVVPVTSVLFMTVRIIWAIRNATRSAYGEEHGRRDSAASRTLIIIAAVFLVCQIPVCLHLVIETVCQYWTEAEILIPYTQAAALIFQCINSTFNFFIFYYKTTKFRNAFIILWHRNCTCMRLRFGGVSASSSSSTPPLRMQPMVQRRGCYRRPVL